MNETKELSTKTVCVLLLNNYKVYLTPKQAEVLSNDLIQGLDIIKINDYIFNKVAIMAILPASDIQRDDRIKRGEWTCKRGNWHTRNAECECIFQERLKREYEETQERISERVATDT